MNYIIEANLGFAFFYGIYFLLMRNETDFRKQRVFLLMGLGCSLIFPFIHVREEIQTAFVTVLPELVFSGKASASVSKPDLVVVIYLFGIIAIASPLLLHIIKIYRTAQSYGTYKGAYYIIESNSNNPSWSFFHLIFIGQADRLSAREKDLIVKHEMLHSRLFHSADILFVTILCLACWFNPVLWIYRRTLARV